MDDGFAMGYAMGQDSGGGRSGGNGGFMDGANSWIWIIVVFALLFGWGNNGNNGRGGNGGGGDTMPTFVPYPMGGFNASSADTRAAISDGFALNNLQSGVNAVQQGICSLGYDQLAQMNNLGTSIQQGFNGVSNAICTLGYQNQQGFNTLGSQLASCCCDIQRGIDGVNYNMASNTCAIQNTIQNTTRDILDNNNANTRAVLDFLTQDKINTLQAENQALKFQASRSEQNAYLTANQSAQTAELIRRLGRDCPVPAFVVPNPNCCYGPYGASGYSGNGCGCGNSCC